MVRDDDFEALLGGQDSGSYDTEAKAGGSGWFKRKKKGILTATKDKAFGCIGLDRKSVV